MADFADSQLEGITQDGTPAASQSAADPAISIRTSQLMLQAQLPSGLIPETEPEFFSQDFTASVSVGQPQYVSSAAEAGDSVAPASITVGTEFSQHQQPQQHRQQPEEQYEQQQRTAASGRAATSVASAGGGGGAGWSAHADFDDDIDDLITEHTEQQQQQHHRQHQQQQHRPAQQQQRQPQQQQRAGPAAAAWDDDEFDDLLQEQHEMQRQQQQQRQASRQQQQAWDYPLDDPFDDPDLMSDVAPPPQHQQQQHKQQQDGRGGLGDQPHMPAGRGGAAAAADLDAELDDLLAETAAAQQPGRAAAAAAGGGAELDFDDELDAMFGAPGAADGDSGPQTASQAMPPPPPKPIAIASLGVGGAAAASRKAAAASALAALQAAALPPKQLVSEVTGPRVTVTGSTGARVYCQLAAAPAAAAAATMAAGSSRGLLGSSSRSGLLQQPIGDLLDMLAERRRQEVMAEVEAAQAAADRVEAAARGEPDGSADDDGTQEQQQQQQVPQAQEAAAAAAASAAAVPRQLWVDKYAPKSFLALLSEPRINREIAAWMARWHKPHQAHTAHQHHQHQQQQQQPPQQQGGRGGAGRGRGAGRQAGAAAAAGGRGAGRSGGGRGGGNGAGEGGRQGGISRGFDAARYKALQEARAAARVLLVVGPPGTGKTTLAHVIARHCGFRVVEVNASDARTASSLTRAVTDAAEMAPVLDSSRRRPCIVLDELDGAAGGNEAHSAVAALVKLLTGEGRSKKRKRGAKGAAGGASGGLSVPVICTANDAYAPCLRPLKDIAAVYHFKPPAGDKLSARLAAIAAAEGLSLDKQALSTLVEHSGADVRTAINTLQLLARQHAPAHSISTQAPGSSSSQSGSSQRRVQRVRITASDIAASGAFGVKDVSHTPLGVVQDLLASDSSRAMAARLQQLAAAMKAEQRGVSGSGRNSRRASRGAVPPASLSASAAARLVLQEHYNTLLDLGEHEQVLCVLHESLPDLVGLDVDLACTTAAADALADADILMASSRGGAGGGSSSWQYVPAPILTVVGLVRRDAAGIGLGSAAVNLAWPRAQAECSRSSTAVRALLRSWRAGSPAHAARALGSSADGLLDLAPALRDLSRPAAVRAVASQLLSRDEDRVLTHVVDALVAYGLTYSFPVEDDDEEGRAPRAAPLAPAVDTLHTYSALSQPVARFLGDRRALKPGWAKAMPLMMRQMLAQRISTAVITRLEQARHGGGGDQAAGQTPGKAAAAGGLRMPLAPAGQKQQMPAADSKGRSTGGPSKKPPPLPKASKGCWLDTLKVQAHAKRRAAILAVGASKRAAMGQGPRPTAAAAAGEEGEGEPLCTPPEAGGGGAAAEGGHNGYTVLYKFNEGYTNAVKRPIKMAELLGLQHAAQ